MAARLGRGTDACEEMFPFSMTMVPPKRSGVAALAALFAAALPGCSDQVETTSADRFRQTGELIAWSGGNAGAANACFTCHGVKGNGNGAGSPRLAGLGVGYIERQLEAYASGERQHESMAWIARRLSQRDRWAVSAYYAALDPTVSATPPVGPPPALWVRGDPSRGLQSCASCHGMDGQGWGPANPPLAGQPAAYLSEQIERWRQAKRRTDPGNIMLRISQKLTRAEAEALSAYAASLPAGPPSPEPAAAFPAGRRDDPRSDASAPPPYEAAPARAAPTP